ncbi:MAG: hypothetical protein Kow00133_04170 [Amphiplicatus sp.]
MDVFTDISNLRLAGLTLGAVSLWVSISRLRRAQTSNLAALMLGSGGAVVFLTSFFPGAVTVFSDFLTIGQYPGSRLIALLILASVTLWMAIAWLSGLAWKNKLQLDQLIRRIARNEFEQEYRSMRRDDAGCILCIIPALNEADNIGAVLDRMPKTLAGLPVVSLVVDDGSTDDTADVSRAHGALVVRSPFQRGGGAAIRLGFDVAELACARIAVNLDADGQNDPQEMSGLVKPILEDEADVVIGSRILGSHEITHWWRHVGVKLFSAIFNILMSTRITDISSGYRAIRVERLKDLRLYQDQYHTSEFLMMCAKLGLRIREAPIRFARRKSGKSKKGNELLYGFRFARALFTAWVRAR